MSDDLEALSPLAKRLLEAEQRRPPVGDDIAERLLARVGESVAAGVVASSAAGTAAAAKAGTSAVAAAGLSAKAAPWIVLAFVAGGGAGAALHAVATPPPAAVPAPSLRPAPSLAPSAVSPPLVASALTPPAPIDLPVAPANVVPSTRSSVTPTPSRVAPPSPSTDVDLAAERALIDRVRMALARGQSDAALEGIAEHASRFSRGRLVEEREALAVQALAQGGRTADAQQRAERFRKTYPSSLFLPAVDAVTKAP